MNSIKGLLFVSVLLITISLVSATWWNPADWFKTEPQFSPEESICGNSDVEVNEECEPPNSPNNGFCGMTYGADKPYCNSQCICSPVPNICDESQIIMKLSSETNAHGALYNDSNYNIDICYKDIFGTEYNGTNPHGCSANNANLALKINDYGNAHVSGIGSSYLRKVCFGDLQCSSRSTCQTDEELIVSLSGDTNAHIAKDNSYPIKICCKSASSIITKGCDAGELLCLVDDVEQCALPEDCDEFIGCKNNTSNNICETGESCDCADCDSKQDECDIGLTCELETKSCEESEEVEGCNVGELLCLVDDVEQCAKPEDCDEFIGCKNNTSNNICETGESCDCIDCYGYKDGCDVRDNLICDYETETCQPCPSGLQYSVNRDNSLLNTCFPIPPLAIEIIHPPKADSINEYANFIINKNISFNQEILDANKLIRNVNVEWIFGDGDNESLTDCLTDNCNTTHLYDNHGIYTIDLIANEQLTEREDKDSVSIFVNQRGLNVFAIITKPARGTTIQSNVPVEFDASDSFVRECFDSMASCTAKFAPINGSCFEISHTNDKLYCFNYPRPDETDFDQFEYKLTFKWKFFKAITNDEDEIISWDELEEQAREGVWETGEDDYNEVVEFTKSFRGESGTKYAAELKIVYKK